MAKIKVDRNKCIACGTCYSLYPECFEEGPEGKSQVKSHDYKSHSYNKDEIISSCPAEAISI
jgi:ferredoxin